MSLPRPDGRVTFAPSILAADMGRLAEAVRTAERAGADWIQVDVMDGHFVPNLSFGPAHVRDLKKATRLALDVHLMVEKPWNLLRAFADAGADLLTVHVEACPRPGAVLDRIKALGVKAGLAVKPRTPASALKPYLGRLDLALVMTVEPGFGGQGFLAGMLPKVRKVRGLIAATGRKTWLQVDGGINLRTAPDAARAGADSLVAGTAVFGAKDPTRALKDLRTAAQAARFL